MKKGKKKFTAGWTKIGSEYITGYQIRYSVKKNMKKAKTRTVKSAKRGKLTVKKLKDGKKYYVQVRTYLQKDGIRYYSAWSETRTVKVRK